MLDFTIYTGHKLLTALQKKAQVNFISKNLLLNLLLKYLRHIQEKSNVIADTLSLFVESISCLNDNLIDIKLLKDSQNFDIESNNLLKTQLTKTQNRHTLELLKTPHEDIEICIVTYTTSLYTKKP